MPRRNLGRVAFQRQGGLGAGCRARGPWKTRVQLAQGRNGAQRETWPMSSRGGSTLDVGSFHADGCGATAEPWGGTASALCPAYCSPSLLPSLSGRARAGESLQSPWGYLQRPGSLPILSWAHSQVPERLTCSPMSWGWFPTGTLVMPGRSMRVRSGTSGEVMSTLMSSWLMLTQLPAMAFWAAGAESGGKPRGRINDPSEEKQWYGPLGAPGA